MRTLSSIFDGKKIFRIPDYQRGYSWERKHLKDFWQDLKNLQPDKFHYTGMIIMQKVESHERENWIEDQWLFNNLSNSEPLYIVDGQQRLTTIIILIWVLLESIDGTDILGNFTKDELITKYIVKKNRKNADEKSFIFGYEVDNPSFHYLKTEIFGFEDNSTTQPETAYTNSLAQAKNFFEQKIKNFDIAKKEKLFDKLTERLIFDFNKLDKKLDIFVVFETLNNRGKDLSNLESLKNRLIYLTTLLRKNNEEKNKLRKIINDTWKTIYKYLGLNKENSLNDDFFLKNHWIMYHGYDRSIADSYAEEIFTKVFTIQNTVDKSISRSKRVFYGTIERYVNSLKESIIEWYKMFNPLQTLQLANQIKDKSFLQELELHQETALWLNKLQRLGYRAFAPIVLAALVKEKEEDKKIRLLKSIEAFIFLLFNISYRRSNTGSYYFYGLANDVYQQERNLDYVINDVNIWTYGKNSDFYNQGYFDIDSFYNHLKDLFSRDKNGKKGYYNWKALKYFMIEYELFLRENHQNTPIDLNLMKQLQRNDYRYQITAKSNLWRKQYGKKGETHLIFNLGNLLLSTTNPTLNLEFQKKKEYFKTGTYSEKKVANNYSEWTAKNVLLRGLELIKFLQKRWELGDKIDDSYEKKLLFIEEISKNKQNEMTQ